jgi:hypothetical protein
MSLVRFGRGGGFAGFELGEPPVGFGADHVEAGGLVMIPGDGGVCSTLVDAFFLQEVFEGGAMCGFLLMDASFGLVSGWWLAA